jgi:hypothetical protein
MNINYIEDHQYDYDYDGRIIYEMKKSDEQIEEWWYEYSEDGTRITTKYCEEIVCGDTYTEFI